MTESALWAKLNKLMKGKWKASRHEDILSAGIPDVSFSISNKLAGWIELKAKFSFRNGILIMPTLTPEQRIWLYNRKYNCFVLAADENRWIFMNSIFVLQKKVKIKYLSICSSENVNANWIIKVLKGCKN